MKHTIRCRGFRAFAKGTLVGFAVIHIAELRLTVHDVALHRKGASRWAQLPAKPMLRDGRQVADEATGKTAVCPHPRARRPRDTRRLFGRGLARRG
jgi:hypothetical protein